MNALENTRNTDGDDGMTIPEDVRHTIREVLVTTLGIVTKYGGTRTDTGRETWARIDAALAWLDAQPSAAAGGDAVTDYTLAPCPFCGGEAELLTGGVSAMVRCNGCGASTAWQRRPKDGGPVTERGLAVGLWNSRVDARERWEPVEDAEITLPDDLRICRRVEAQP
jgi:hypothetical protein